MPACHEERPCSAHRSWRSCIVGSLHSSFVARSEALSGFAAMALHRKPTAGPSGRSPSALPVGAEVPGHAERCQEDVDACACLHASGMRPRRLSSLRRFFPTVIIRAGSPAVSPCPEASGIRRILFTHLRFSPMSSESTRQRHRHLLAISPHGSPLQPPPSTPPVSTPSRYKADPVPMCSPLRSKHSPFTARSQ